MNINFPPHLPIVAVLPVFQRLLLEHRVVIVCGTTGSGKTTQIPKAVIAAGCAELGVVVQSQPRRIAVRNVAYRLAEECKIVVGTGSIGYAVRFEERLSAENRLQIVTDGLLLTWLQRDPWLKKAKVVIIDEAHERSVTIDVLLGLLYRLLKKRHDLKVVIMSATLDTELFSNFFKGAPVLECSARGYPIEYGYAPIPNGCDRFDWLLQTITSLLQGTVGDFLVFCSGEGEIRRAMLKLSQAKMAQVEVLPLYARLKTVEQQKIFAFSQKRRIILATNVAETSLTVPNIHFVIDFGQARISRYNARTKIQCLGIEPIARANADQRAGRCGRIAPGTCVRLYTEEDYLQRAPVLEPEILRSNLAQVILQLLSMGVSEPENFPWITQAEPAMFKEGWRVLEHLGAVTQTHALTELGRKIARLPLDPSLGSIVLASTEYHCLEEVLIIVSALELPSLLENTEVQVIQEKRLLAFGDHHSDFNMLLKLWSFLKQQKQLLSNSAYKKILKEHGIQEFRAREWREAYTQLSRLAQAFGLKKNQIEADNASLHKALLTGMLGGIGCKLEKDQYQGLRQIRFVLAKPYPKALKKEAWVMAFELTETAKIYARMVAVIDPTWVEEVAKPLLKRQYSDPFWHAPSNRACIKERVSLFGLAIIFGRKRACAVHDPDTARALLIQEGLVGRQWQSKAYFWKYNVDFLLEQEKQEERFRQAAYVLEDAAQYNFYNTRIPKEVVDGQSLEAWLKTVPKETLCFSRALIEQTAPVTQHLEQDFPTEKNIAGVPLQLRYCFQPGDLKDGVTFLLPELLVSRFTAEDFSWLVQGLLEERIIALLKTLPKTKRRSVMPVSFFSRAFLERCEVGQGDLLAQLAIHLTKMTGIDFSVHDFQEKALPAHLRPRFEVISEKQATLFSGYDLFQKKENAFVPSAFFQEEQETTSWDWEEIPEKVSRTVAGVVVPVYLALQDNGSSVVLTGVEHAVEAQKLHPFGVLRLLKIALAPKKAALKKRLKQIPAVLKLVAYQDIDLFLEQCMELLFFEVFSEKVATVYTQQAFLECIAKNKGYLEVQYALLARGLPAFTEAFLRMQAQYFAKKKSYGAAVVREIEQEWERLLSFKTFATMRLEQYLRLPVYLEAMLKRLEKALRSPEKEALLSKQFSVVQKHYQLCLEKDCKTIEAHGVVDQLFWILQELRVSLFAEQLGAKGGVSLKKVLLQMQAFLAK